MDKSTTTAHFKLLFALGGWRQPTLGWHLLPLSREFRLLGFDFAL